MVGKAILNGKGKSIGIVVSQFNEYITRVLYDGCLDTLVKLGVSTRKIRTLRVPGIFEIPQAARRMIKRGNVDVVIALGCAIKGETKHFEHLGREVMAALCQINSSQDIPVVSGIILANNVGQAIERAGSKQGNKGREAAIAAIEMANLSSQL